MITFGHIWAEMTINGHNGLIIDPFYGPNTPSQP